MHTRRPSMARTDHNNSSQPGDLSRGSVQYLNPQGMLKNRAFSQVVVASGPVKIVYVGAQTPVDETGTVIGKGDIAAQTEQVLKILETCLGAAGAGPEHIAQWNVYIVHDQPVRP